MKFYIYFYCLTVLIFFLFGCEPSPTTQHQEIVQIQERIPPPFSKDTAYFYIEKQLSFGNRVIGSIGHVMCGDFIIRELERFKWSVTEQSFDAVTFDGKILKARNIIGSWNPQATKRILLAAHWDTRPFADQDTIRTHEPIQGANDGASGVAVLLEIARAIQSDTAALAIGIDLLFFDAEDYGEPAWEDKTNRNQTFYCLGSQYWAKTKHIPNYRAYYGILLDMVGAKNAVFTMEGNSMEYAPKIVRKVWDTAEKLGYGNYFVKQQTGAIIDDHYFVNKNGGIPMIDIIHYDDDNQDPFFTHWHKHSDTIEQIDKDVLKAVGHTLLYILYNE